MKKINNKGAVPVGLIILLVVAALAVVAVFAFKGFGFGGGNGDGEGSGIADNSNTVSVVEERISNRHTETSLPGFSIPVLLIRTLRTVRL